MITGIVYDLTNCLNQLTSDLNERYQKITTEKHAQIKEEYVSQLYRLDEWHTFSDQAGHYTGRIKSVTDSGRLQIEKRSGNISVYAFKEVDFIL